MDTIKTRLLLIHKVLSAAVGHQPCISTFQVWIFNFIFVMHYFIIRESDAKIMKICYKLTRRHVAIVSMSIAVSAITEIF